VTANVERYVQRMEEVKKRFVAIETVLKSKDTTGSWQTNFEFVALQLRKVFETIVLATVDSNEGALTGVGSSVFKEWQITKIIKAVERVNPKFYPVPARQSRDGTELLKFEGEYLTLDRLKEFHGKCGDWMHAKVANFGASDFERWHRTFVAWLRLTMSLLSFHTIQLADPDSQLWVGMNEKGSGKVFWNKMELVRAPDE
jgi:hypothetical protein